MVQAAVLVAPNTFELRSLRSPAVDDESAVVAVELCGVCGTAWSGGRVPAHQLMSGRHFSKRRSSRRTPSPIATPNRPRRITPSITRSVRSVVPLKLM